MTNYWRLVFIVLLTVSGLITISGCGGSSSGTGSKTYAGTIESRDGSPQPGVVVTLVETGQQVTTDDLGQFIFEAIQLQGDLTLAFSGPLVDDQLSLQASNEGGDVTIAVVVNEETGEIQDSAVVVQPTESGGDTSSADSSSSSGEVSSSVASSDSSSSNESSSVASADDTGSASSTPSTSSDPDSSGESSSVGSTDSSSSVGSDPATGVSSSDSSAANN